MFQIGDKVFDVFNPHRDTDQAVGNSEPRALFRGTATGHTFWLPNRTCLMQMARAAGFGNVEWVSRFELSSKDKNAFHDMHGAIRATP